MILVAKIAFFPRGKKKQQQKTRNLFPEVKIVFSDKKKCFFFFFKYY